MTRPPRLLALIPAAFALILYLLTCSPTINFLDSGELTTVAWTAGIAHPPGYPLYTLISLLFIHLPFGDPAWRMNVLSALFGALAVGLFYGLVADTLAGMPGFLRAVARPIAGGKAAAGGGRARPPARSTPAAGRPAPRGKEMARGAARGATATLEAPAAAPTPATAAAPAPAVDPAPAWVAAGGALTASGLLACSLTFWNWATQAKMYTLHFAFMAGLLWLGLRARRALYQEVAAKAGPAPRWPPRAWSPGIRRTHGLALLAGLSMTNHYLSNLLWVGMAVLLLAPIGRAAPAFGRILRHAGTIIAAGLAPLLLYLYLPLRAGMQPLLDWGSPDTWGDFWRHVTVWQFSVYIGRDAAGLGGYIGDAAVFAANQLGLPLTLILLLPIGAGLLWLWRTDRGLLAATAVTAIIDLVYTLNYQIREVVVYYIPFYMIALFWAGLGVAWALDAARTRLPAARQAPAWAAFALGALLPLLGLIANWGTAGHLNDRTAEIFTRNAFKSFQPNAVVLTNSWDLVAGSYYLQHVRGERTDVAIIDKALFRYPFYVSYLERVYPDLIRQTEAYLASAPPGRRRRPSRSSRRATGIGWTWGIMG
jgi:hypothetical protein